MIKEQAELLQSKFEQLSEEHSIMASYDHFKNKAGNAMLSSTTSTITK